MNKRLNKILATILVASMLVGMTTILATRAIVPPAFYLLPSTQTFNSPPTTVGTLFTEWLNVSTSGDTFTYQYEVDYDSSMLNCTNAVYFAGATSDFFKGHTTVATGPDTSVAGKVTGGETLLGLDVVPATPTGKGIIIMTFNITKNPPVGGSLTSLISANNVNTFLLDPGLNTVPNVNFGDCNYTNIWTPPAEPEFVVTPPTQYFDGSINRNGSTFTETIAISPLSAGWFAQNASVELDYNISAIVATGFAFDPAWLGTGLVTSNTTGGVCTFTAGNVPPLTTDTNLVTITFKIWNQGSNPPRGFGDSDISHLHLVSPTLGSSAGFYITPLSKVDGLVTVVVFTASAPPFLSVSSANIGPAPALGQQFNITVTFNNVRDFENIIGIQFRLGFDKNVVYPVTSYEGPFLGTYAALQPGSLGTFFVEFTDDPGGVFGPNEVVGNMIFPNGTGRWNPLMLNGTGVVTIITFNVTGQSYGEANFTTPLNIVDEQAIALDSLTTQNIVFSPLSDPHNGTVSVTTNLPGRMIDLFGGAVNSGMGPLIYPTVSYPLSEPPYATTPTGPYPQFPMPFGGQGPEEIGDHQEGPGYWMDIVEPQSWVYLHALVTYNYWPVQFKNVAFEIDMPNGTVYTKLSAFTDPSGIASVGFRMPWPCDVLNQTIIGVWHVTATVQLADVTINDTLNYHYDFLVHIWKVTTDMFQYNHNQLVDVSITYGTHAMEPYPALFVITITDELGVTVGLFEYQATLQGATDCIYLNTTTQSLDILIPKWAYAGIGTVHVAVFNWEPALGGVAIGPEYDGPTIAIQPA